MTKLDNVMCMPCINHLFKHNARNVTIQEAIRKVSEYINIPVRDLQSKKRDAYLVDGRRMIAGILYCDNSFRLTKCEIGRFLGGRDHTTVIHLLRSLQIICETYPDFMEKYRDLHFHVFGHDKNISRF